jgi:hypothetical protein
MTHYQNLAKVLNITNLVYFKLTNSNMENLIKFYGNDFTKYHDKNIKSTLPNEDGLIEKICHFLNKFVNLQDYSILQDFSIEKFINLANIEKPCIYYEDSIIYINNGNGGGIFDETTGEMLCETKGDNWGDLDSDGQFVLIKNIIENNKDFEKFI